MHSFLVVLPIVPVDPHESRADHLTSDYIQGVDFPEHRFFEDCRCLGGNGVLVSVFCLGEAAKRGHGLLADAQVQIRFREAHR